ncbi:MAG: hypothetical protein AAB623_02915 [Patescibacteria group bacterium]
MKKILLNLKNDKYRTARGGHSRFLNLYCASCKSNLLLYQKDGPGALKRLYIDRIFSKEISKKGKELTCKSCKKVIGTFFIYRKENRPAIRLYQDAIFKKVSKGFLSPQ